MKRAPILGSLGAILSGPANFPMFRLERISENSGHTNWMKIKIDFGCLRLNIHNTALASTDKVKTDSSIVENVEYLFRDALVSGTILPFSSTQIELVLKLDLLFGRSGLSFFPE